MKRLLIFSAAVLLGATLTQAETIAWWLPNWDEKPARAIVADYESTNPGEKVEIVITAWDTMAQKILVGLQSRNAPDVITERIAMYHSGPFDVQPILEAGIKVGTGVLPGVNGMGVTTVDGFSLIVPAHSSRLKAAKQFVAFVGQPEKSGTAYSHLSCQLHRVEVRAV